MKIKLGTVFSGVGAIEESLRQLNIDYKIEFACDNGERYIELAEDEIEQLKSQPFNERNEAINNYYSNTKKDNFVKQTYLNNFEINSKLWFEDIRFISGEDLSKNIDLFVGGSPCQSFSVIGKRAGLQDTRGTLFYEFARLIDEIKPKVFIYENVVGLKNHDKGNTWRVVHEVFESLDYDYFDFVLNSKDFGLPQNRSRVFIIGFKKSFAITKFDVTKKEGPLPHVSKYLDEIIDNSYYLGKKGFEFVTNPKYKNRAKVNSKIIMCQKANQQFNWNGDFIFEEVENHYQVGDFIGKAYVGEFDNKKGIIRKLTPKECFNLMGFSNDYKLPTTVHDTQLYRQSGNSIAVPVLKSIVEAIIETGVFNEEH